MSNPPMPPFLQSFGGDLLALVAGFLLPRIRRRAWWHACGQLVGAAVLALAAALHHWELALEGGGGWRFAPIMPSA
jgi:hypothetical protein